MAGEKEVENSSGAEARPSGAYYCWIPLAAGIHQLRLAGCGSGAKSVSVPEAAGFPLLDRSTQCGPRHALRRGNRSMQLTRSSILVLILSAQSVASAHVGKELERAISKRHPSRCPPDRYRTADFLSLNTS